MSHRRDLKLLRRAQKQAKRQLRQLAQLELTGLTAVTLHAHTRRVTVTLAAATGAPFTDALREALHERRQALQAQAQHLLLTPAFRRGVAALGPLGYTYDLLILPDQLGYARQLVANFPNQPFILDHLAKPPIKACEIDGWARDIRQLAARPNVYCKASGLVTEADWHAWQPADFRPYLDVVFEAFGPRRVLFGSDWPVCNVAGGYAAAVGLAHDYLAAFSAAEQAQFWGENATAFYSLSA